MEILKFIKRMLKIKEKEKEKEKVKECKNDEYCPIYLSYAYKYGDKSENVKYCKNSNKQYCTKYRLIKDDEWKKLDKDDKIRIIKKISLVEFIDKD
jgi:hypothetical protein